MPIKNFNNQQDMDFKSLENFKKFLENENTRRNFHTNNKNIKENLENSELDKNENIYDQNFPLEEEDYNEKEEEEQNNDEEKNFENYAKEVKLNTENRFSNKLVKEKPDIEDLFRTPRTKNKINPLLQYRDPGISIKIPSLGKYYTDEIELEANGEINVFPLTIKDEIYLRSPEYLLNGSAIEKIIQSCVPSVKNPKNLLTNDVLALLMAIKWASGSEIVTYSSECPKCKSINNFDIKISYLFDHMTYLKESYSVDLDNKIIVFVKPFDYQTVVKNAVVKFEESKLLQILNEDEELSEEEKIKKAKESLEKVQDMVLFSVMNSITKVFLRDKNLTIDDKEMILEWLKTLKIKDFNKIKNLIAEINDIGLPNSVNVTCRNCNTKYDIEVKYDPADFLD